MRAKVSTVDLQVFSMLAAFSIKSLFGESLPWAESGLRKQWECVPSVV